MFVFISEVKAPTRPCVHSTIKWEAIEVPTPVILPSAQARHGVNLAWFSVSFPLLATNFCVGFLRASVNNRRFLSDYNYMFAAVRIAKPEKLFWVVGLFTILIEKPVAIFIWRSYWFQVWVSVISGLQVQCHTVAVVSSYLRYLFYCLHNTNSTTGLLFLLMQIPCVALT